ncbi:MAG: hypothetical protein GX193_06055 [Clostridiales bacterium]|nr:hypothetical protein [Clostridiales bacterium]
MSNKNGEALAVFATIVALALSREFDIDELNTLSCFFSALSSNICIITSQRASAVDAPEVEAEENR